MSASDTNAGHRRPPTLFTQFHNTKKNYPEARESDRKTISFCLFVDSVIHRQPKQTRSSGGQIHRSRYGLLRLQLQHLKTTLCSVLTSGVMKVCSLCIASAAAESRLEKTSLISLFRRLSGKLQSVSSVYKTNMQTSSPAHLRELLLLLLLLECM